MKTPEVLVGLGELAEKSDLSTYYQQVCSAALKLLGVGQKPNFQPVNRPHGSPADKAWSRAIKKNALTCAVCGGYTMREDLEAMHCVRRGHDILRPGFDEHSLRGGCCLRHDLTNGAAGCKWCHAKLHREPRTDEAFWRSYFKAQGFPVDHYDNLQAERLRLNKRVPRPA